MWASIRHWAGLSGSLGDSPHFPGPTPAQNPKHKTPSRLGSIFPPLFLPCATLGSAGRMNEIINTAGTGPGHPGSGQVFPPCPALWASRALRSSDARPLTEPTLRSSAQGLCGVCPAGCPAETRGQRAPGAGLGGEARVTGLRARGSFIFPDGAVPSILNDMESDPFIKISKLLYDYDYLAFT